MKRNIQFTLSVLGGAALFMLLQSVTIQAQNESAPPLPPPGKLVDVGGWRLHLHCTGEARAGQPTVILEPGIGDFSVEWSLVQPGVAKFARVCSYDRAGNGWSDWGPHPRTYRQIVYELHTLLDKAGVKLPPEAQRMRVWARGQLGHIAAGVNPFEMEELAALRAEQAKSEYPFGDKPLIVLTRGIPEEPGPEGKVLEEERRRNHAAVAKRSRQGKLIVATRSGHHIQMDEPELVIQSIRDVANAASQKKGDVLKDKDGNAYTAKVMLDGKRWMTQNLILKVTGAYCFDDKQANCDRYGRLYTWEAAKQACNLLGDGWRLPTNEEWRAMAKHYGGIFEKGGATGKDAYQSLLSGGASGFNALLGGNRELDGKYARVDAHGFYWSATEQGSGAAWFLNFAKGKQALYFQEGGEKSSAWSVRCVRP